MSEESLLIRATAYHEAGHAVFVLGSPFAETFVSVEISAETPFRKWGEVVTSVAGGKTIWPSDCHMEFGRCLSGPLAEVLFVGESFEEGLRVKFGSAILRAIGEDALFDEVRSRGWWCDLKYFSGTLEFNLKQEDALSFDGFLAFEKEVGQPGYGDYLANEDRLRKWMDRRAVKEAIHAIAEKLIEKRKLDRRDCEEILRDHPEVTGSVLVAGFTDDAESWDCDVGEGVE